MKEGAYFARRAQVIASLSFFALCGAGWVLSLWQHSTAAWWGFVLIFALAGSARILSALGLVSRSRCASDRPPGGSARISWLLPSERDERTSVASCFSQA